MANDLRRAWLGGYRRSDVATVLARGDIDRERLQLELEAVTQRANAMQVEIRELHARIDARRRRRRRSTTGPRTSSHAGTQSANAGRPSAKPSTPSTSRQPGGTRSTASGRTAAATSTSSPRTNAQTPSPASTGRYEPANAP